MTYYTPYKPRNKVFLESGQGDQNLQTLFMFLTIMIIHTSGSLKVLVFDMLFLLFIVSFNYF